MAIISYLSTLLNIYAKLPNVSYPDPHTAVDFCPLENPLGAARLNVMFLFGYGDASVLLAEKAAFCLWYYLFIAFLSSDIFNCY